MARRRPGRGARGGAALPRRQLIERLRQGIRLLAGHGPVTWKAVDRREQVADVAGQEIMTADKVTLRVNLAGHVSGHRRRQGRDGRERLAQALYREAQLALRAAVGTRTIDALLADKEAVGAEVRKRAGAAPSAVRRHRPERRPARHHPSRRHEDDPQPGHRGPEGGRGQPDPAARGDGRGAQPGQHRQAARREPAPRAPQGARAAPGDARRRKTTFVFGQGEMPEQVRGLDCGSTLTTPGVIELRPRTFGAAFNSSSCSRTAVAEPAQIPFRSTDPSRPPPPPSADQRAASSTRLQHVAHAFAGPPPWR